MIICGLQKLTLLDYPGKMSCIIFTKGCDFRCPFCHNASLVVNTQVNDDRSYDIEPISEAEIFSFLKKRKGILEGVVITGGEPTLQKDLISFISAIKELGYNVKLDTNGNHPQVIKDLLQLNLIDYIAMDIKNCKEKYSRTIGLSKFDITNIIHSVDIIKNSDIDYEFRTTVVEAFHKEEDFESIGKWIAGAKAYYLQNFVDSGDLIVPGLQGVTPKKMATFADIASRYVHNTQLRGL